MPGKEAVIAFWFARTSMPNILFQISFQNSLILYVGLYNYVIDKIKINHASPEMRHVDKCVHLIVIAAAARRDLRVHAISQETIMQIAVDSVCSHLPAWPRNIKFKLVAFQRLKNDADTFVFSKRKLVSNLLII